ncbi:MAG: MBL fold metallo-hydrolase [Clostridia bacterium]|nr:MBL fold metallo-hydrolase [Clostridia bacterium]
MKVTWIGQAGFLFETDGLTVMADPYLSNSCQSLNPESYRRYPVDESVFDVKPDVIILTHDHLDHTDPETLDHFLKGTSGVTVLASGNAWKRVKAYGRAHEYVLFDRGAEFTVKGVTFRAVYACHSDERAVGVIFRADGKTCYLTGDTLYHNDIFKEITEPVDALFLPINGKGNNMNAFDADRFATRIAPGKTIPCHFGLFDEIDPAAVLHRSDLVIPKPFCEVKL